jgi:hypothetical protein
MKKIKAYKVLNPDYTCRGFKYEIGKSYKLPNGQKPVLCKVGFHACVKVSDCFSYYSFDPKNKVVEVILSGIVLREDDDKQCADNIKIIKELSWGDMLELANSGKCNSGYGNSGNSNSGYGNSGNSNSGYGNSGNSNSGNSNSGYGNSGDSNSGNRNSGYGNSGDWNLCDRETGFFNSDESDHIRVFNKPCKKSVWDNCNKPDFINIRLNEWIEFSDMTEEEKKSYPNAYVCDGYLKRYEYKEAWKMAFGEATKEDIALLKKLPNFDNEVFKKITGIKI